MTRSRHCAEVAGLLHNGNALLTSVNAAEVCDQMVRIFGADPDAIEADGGEVHPLPGSKGQRP